MWKSATSNCRPIIEFGFGWAWGDMVTAISIQGQCFWWVTYSRFIFEISKIFIFLRNSFISNLFLNTYSSTSPTGRNEVDGLPLVWKIIRKQSEKKTRKEQYKMVRHHPILVELTTDKNTQRKLVERRAYIEYQYKCVKMVKRQCERRINEVTDFRKNGENQYFLWKFDFAKIHFLRNYGWGK